MRLDRIARELAQDVFVRHGPRERSARRGAGVHQERREREASRHTIPVHRRLDGGEAVSAAVHSGLCRWLRLPRRIAAAGEPRARRACRPPIRARRCASGRISSPPRTTGDAARRHPHGARRRPAVAACAVRRQARSRRARQSDAEIDAHIRATGITVHHPARHLPDGQARRRGGGRSRIARARRRSACAWSTLR